MPAPKGNLNASRNGTRLVRLIAGTLPKKLHRVTRFVRRYRRDLEAAVSEAHGEVGILHAHTIDRAVQHQQHMGVCRHLLRERFAEMSIADIRECSRAIADAADKRDKAVRELGLERQDDAQQLIEALYAPSEGA